MAKITLLFVENLGNSWLLPAVLASIRLILSHFSFVAVLCKGLLLSDQSLKADYVEFLDVYEKFLAIKEKIATQTSVDDASVDRQTKEWADVFSWFLHRCLTHENINEEYRKYLVL